MSDDTDEAIEQVVLALGRYLRAWVDASADAGKDAAREIAGEAMSAAIANTDEADRRAIAEALMSLSSIAFELYESPTESAEREAERILRSSYLEQLHEQYDAGNRELEWPPGPDVEWDELRVMVGQFMERRLSDWPQIALAEKPGLMMYSPFATACQGAQFFAEMWRRADSREDLLEHMDEAHVAAWETYLELPPKRPRG